jgi:urease gamma subunit
MQLTPRERQMAISMGRSGPQAAGPWFKLNHPAIALITDAVVEARGNRSVADMMMEAGARHPRV